MAKKICVKVNGQKVPLNPFVTGVFLNVINGLVDALHKIPAEKRTVEILIEEENK